MLTERRHERSRYPAGIESLPLLRSWRGPACISTKAELAFLEEVLRRRVGHAATSTANYLLKPRARSAPRRDGRAGAGTHGQRDLFLSPLRSIPRLCRGVLCRSACERATVRETLSLLSAGCASGEEAYSIAIVARELVDPSWDRSIRAVDLNPAALERRRRAAIRHGRCGRRRPMSGADGSAPNGASSSRRRGAQSGAVQHRKPCERRSGSLAAGGL